MNIASIKVVISMTPDITIMIIAAVEPIPDVATFNIPDSTEEINLTDKCCDITTYTL